MSSSIEAVLFDADQTLWDFQRVMHRALRFVLRDLEEACGEMEPGWPTVADLMADRDAAAAELPPGTRLERIRYLGFERSLARLGVVDDRLAASMTDSYFRYRDATPELFDDVLSCLDALEGQVRLGVLSNGSRLPERCGLKGRFEVVVFAQDHGSAKPDRRIFDVTASLLGLPEHALALVGDHVVNDVAGAKGAGWTAIWLDRAHTAQWPGHPDVRPDGVVTSLHQLPHLLGLD